MKLQLYLLFGLLFALLIAIFAVVNGGNVEFNYVFGTVKWPLVLIILGSAAIGGVSVGLFGLIKMIQLSNTIKRMRQDQNQGLQYKQKPIAGTEHPVEDREREDIIK